MKIVLLLSCIGYLIRAGTAAASPGPRPPPTSYYRSNGRLNVIQFKRHYIEGEYSNDRSGIHFRSDGGTASNYIIITNHDGRNIFSSFKLDETTTLMSVMGGDYLITKRRFKEDRFVTTRYYRVPRTRRNVVMKILKSGIPLKYLSQAKYLDSRNVKAASARDFQALLWSEEAQLVHQSALEMGKRGLYGIDSTGGMLFYVLAMRLANHHIQPAHQPRTRKGSDYSDCGFAGFNTEAFKELMRAKYLPAPSGLALCENNWQYCDTCPRGRLCSGGCGVGCECWKMVCGDCCYHHGCFGHRQCGCTGDKVSFGCFNVFGFKCDTTYICEP